MKVNIRLILLQLFPEIHVFGKCIFFWKKNTYFHKPFQDFSHF